MSMSSVRRAVVLAALVVTSAVAALTGCSSASTNAGAAEATGLPAGGTLRVAIGQSEPSLGVLDYKTHSFNLLDQIYEPLVRYGQDGEIVPALATSWKAAADGRSITFTLRQGVTFSDGEAFDSAAAAAGLKRWIGNDDHSWMGITKDVSAIETPDASTLVLKLDKPYYPALQELTYVRPSRFASPKAFDADGELVAPIGTGPYKVSTTSETEIVLVRNDSYWGGRPNLDRVIFKVIPDAQARVAALRAGEVDLIGGDYLAALAPTDAAALRADTGVKVLTAPSSTNLLLTFNQTSGHPALKDPAVRQAINWAVDREGYAEALFTGFARPATEIFPESIPYAPQAGRMLGLDAEKAKGLLESAGWTGTGTRTKDGRPLELTLILDPDQMPQAKALSEAVQANLKTVGIDVRIASLESTAFSDTAAKRQYDLMFYLTYGPPYAPSGLLGDGFRTTEEAYQIYSSPELDGQIDAALSSVTDADRTAAYGRIWKLLNDGWAAAPLLETQRIWAVRSDVRGFELGVTEYDLPLLDVGIAP